MFETCFVAAWKGWRRAERRGKWLRPPSLRSCALLLGLIMALLAMKGAGPLWWASLTRVSTLLSMTAFGYSRCRCVPRSLLAFARVDRCTLLVASFHVKLFFRASAARHVAFEVPGHVPSLPLRELRQRQRGRRRRRVAPQPKATAAGSGGDASEDVDPK